VEPLLAFQQYLFGLPAVGIVYTTVYWAYGGALRLFVKTHTFCAFIRDDIIKIIGYRVVLLIRIYFRSIFQLITARDASTVGDSPFHTPFVYSIVGAFWFASPAVDTFVCYNDCHNILVFNFNIT